MPAWPSAAAGRCSSSAARWSPAPRWRRTPGSPSLCWSSSRWLLRSGSLAASAAGDRRRLRGRRWYDGVQFLVAAPWHLVRSIPGHDAARAVERRAGRRGRAGLLRRSRPGSRRRCSPAGWSSRRRCGSGPGSSAVRSPLARVVHPRSAGGAPLAGGAAAGPRRRPRCPATAPTRSAWTGRRATARRGAGCRCRTGRSGSERDPGPQGAG